MAPTPGRIRAAGPPEGNAMTDATAPASNPASNPNPNPTPPAAPHPASTCARTRPRRILLAALRCLALAACGGAAEALTTWLLQH